MGAEELHRRALVVYLRKVDTVRAHFLVIRKALIFLMAFWSVQYPYNPTARTAKEPSIWMQAIGTPAWENSTGPGRRTLRSTLDDNSDKIKAGCAIRIGIAAMREVELT